MPLRVRRPGTRYRWETCPAAWWRPRYQRERGGERGAFLILAAVFLLIVLAFMAVVFLSTFTTSTSTSLNEIQSTRALYVAEGGMAFHQRDLAMNLDWYRSSADPLLTTLDKLLGMGKFTATTTLPATMLRNRIPTAASTAPIRSYTTDNFPQGLPTDPPQPWYIQVEDDMNGSAEYIQYTAINPASDTFEGTITRNVTIGGVFGDAGAGPHERGSLIYPVTFYQGYNGLPNNLPADCDPLKLITSLTLTYHPKFLQAGTLAISTYNGATVDVEEISYTGRSVLGGNLILSGIKRCENNTLPVAHIIGNPVTPLLCERIAGEPDFEAEVVATGAAGDAGRVVRQTIQR